MTVVVKMTWDEVSDCNCIAKYKEIACRIHQYTDGSCFAEILVFGRGVWGMPYADKSTAKRGCERSLNRLTNLFVNFYCCSGMVKTKE